MRICLLLSLLVFNPQALAELQQCSGVWTNIACGELSAKPRATDKNEEEKNKSLEKSKKKSLLHELSMRSISARDKYDLKISLSDVEQLCLDDKTTVEQCRERTEELAEKIDKQSNALAMLEEQKKANKLQEEKNKIAESQTTVVINERRRYPYRLIDHPGRRYYKNKTRSGASINFSADGNGFSVGVNSNQSSKFKRARTVIPGRKDNSTETNNIVANSRQPSSGSIK